MRSNRQLVILVWMWMVFGGLSPAAQETAPPSGGAAGRVGIDDFRRAHAGGMVFVIDVRGAAAFKAGHIPGAVNVPLDQMERRAAEIRAKAKGRAIVTYCSCPEEHASLAAVRVLSSKGVSNARALVGGYPAWVASRSR